MSWREYVCKQLADVEDLGSQSETFHLFNSKSGEAISTQTLYTLADEFIDNPEEIYEALKIYIDTVANYSPRSETDLALVQIKSKTIHLAIPERTSPVQWQYLFKAIIYGKENGVSIVITKIRE